MNSNSDASTAPSIGRPAGLTRVEQGEVVVSNPVIARRHPTTLFDPVEEPLYLVASTVEIGAEADRIAAVAFRRNVGPCAFLHGKLSDPVRIIATVGKRHHG